MNKLHQQYGKKGLTIVGVTDESASKIEKYVEEKGIEYTVAIGGAGDYKTRGIPAAWLVAPDGKVVWQGHPASLKNSAIEEHLANVRMGPSFKLPRELGRAQKMLNAGAYAKGIKELEKYLKKPKSEDVAAQAKKALETIAEYQKSELAQVEKDLEEGLYVEVRQRLASVQKMFKGLDSADQAKSRLKELESSSEHKNEMGAAKLIAKAELYIAKRSYKGAVAYLRKVVKTKKYADTKMREHALKLLNKYESKI